MSKVDMLIKATLYKSIPLRTAWYQVSREPPSAEELKEFNECLFRCEYCGNWCPSVKKNILVDIMICDACLLKNR